MPATKQPTKAELRERLHECSLTGNDLRILARADELGGEFADHVFEVADRLSTGKLDFGKETLDAYSEQERRILLAASEICFALSNLVGGCEPGSDEELDLSGWLNQMTTQAGQGTAPAQTTPKGSRQMTSTEAGTTDSNNIGTEADPLERFA